MGNVIVKVETKIHDAILAAMLSIAMPRMERAKKSINASPGQEPGIVVLDPDHRDFSRRV